MKLSALAVITAVAFAAPLLAQPVEEACAVERASHNQIGAGESWKQIHADTSPHARHENSMVAIGERLYLIGGRDQRPLDIFDTRTRRWSQGSAPPLMVSHAQAVVVSGRLYFVGGFTGDYPEEASLTHMLIYDPQADTWQVGPEIPAHRRRGAAGAVVHEGMLYLVGGNTRGHMSGYVPWLDAFDTKTQQWTQLADAPHARDHFHAAVIDGKLYAAGGRRSAHESGNTLAQTIPEVDIYDIQRGTWSVAPAALPTQRAGTAAIVRNGQLLIIGGESMRQVKAHGEVEAYDPARSTWTALAALPQGRHGTQAAAVGDDLYIVAGSGNRGGGPELDDVLVLDNAEAMR
ncbi:ring canal kelch [Xanthomonas dyei]|uniref:Ring canal kelch n=1 Tax=Xanthomonas dyei TaxID=743699 RepID=A0A2S7BWM8_9XANT|nr:ring canal kelch [Xanthomonas dyei]